MIDRNTIQKVLDTADIVDVVGEFVSLRRAGVNMKGLCPFHNEKTPSFIVSPSKQLCKCFSCGKGGNVIHFVMEMEQMNYPEAIKWLGRKYGINIKEKELTTEEKRKESARESLFIVNEWAKNYFCDILHNNVDGLAIGLSYLRKRGLRDDIIKKFDLGYAPDERESLSVEAVRKGYKKEFLIQTGLCYETDSHKLMDRYHGRVIFPIHSVSGKIVAFGGRILNNDKKIAKYINSPESIIYSKSHELYGLYLAKKAIVKAGCCYMVEGYMDVIAMHQNGVENVVASSGTSLTEGQIRLLHRFTDNIIVLYDGDEAGIHASLRGIDMLLSEGLNIKIVLLPDGDDPDSFAGKNGGTVLKKYLTEHQQDFLQFKISLLLKDVGHDPIKKAELANDIIKSISVIPMGVIRQTYARNCSKMLQVDEALILEEVNKIRQKNKQRKLSQFSAAEKSGEERGDKETAEEAEKIKENLLIRPSIEENELKHEQLLIKQVIRYGETLLNIEENADGSFVAMSVAEFIKESLEEDHLRFKSELFNDILSQAYEHIADRNFRCSDFFLNHPNEEISCMAAECETEEIALSQKQQEDYGDIRKRLEDMIPKLVNEYKYILVQQEVKNIKRELSNIAYNEDDKEHIQNLMQRFMEVSKILGLLGKEIGERVINIE